MEPTALAGSIFLGSAAKLRFTHVKRILHSAVQRLNSDVIPRIYLKDTDMPIALTRYRKVVIRSDVPQQYVLTVPQELARP